MPKQKPENKLSDKEQFKRFKEAAEKAEVDDKEAEKSFARVARGVGAAERKQADP